MIGFEVTKNYLIGLGKYFSEALVFIGKENPFTHGQMKAIVWQKILPAFVLTQSPFQEILCRSRSEIWYTLRGMKNSSFNDITLVAHYSVLQMPN
jgi:hypothetical protein